MKNLLNFLLAALTVGAAAAAEVQWDPDGTIHPDNELKPRFAELSVSANTYLNSLIVTQTMTAATANLAIVNAGTVNATNSVSVNGTNVLTIVTNIATQVAEEAAGEAAGGSSLYVNAEAVTEANLRTGTNAIIVAVGTNVFVIPTNIVANMIAAGAAIEASKLDPALLTATEGDAAYQPLHATLTALAALSTTAYGRSLLETANAAAAQTILSLVPGTHVQAYDADLGNIAALTTAAFGRSLLEQSSAAALKTLLSLTPGTDIQAYDADLAALAGISGVQGDIIYHNGTQWTRLAKGTASQYLRINSGATAPEWATLSAASQTPWTQSIDGGGFNLSNVGTFSASVFNVNTMNLTNALGVASGGTGRTNYSANAIPIFNGTTAANEVLVQSSVTSGSTNLPTQGAVYDYVQTVAAGIEAGDAFAGITGSGETTSNDDFVTLYTYTFPETNLTAQLGAHVLGAGPTNIYGFNVAAVVKNLTGTAAIVGTNNTYIIPPAGTNITAYWDVSGGTARLRARGTEDENVTWVATNIVVNVVTNGAALAEGGGGGEPLTFGGVTGWAFAFFANQGTSTTTDNTGISQWDDVSGNGKHAVQATGANQPTYQENELNTTLPVIQFDGSNDYLAIPSIDLTGTNAVTLFVVATAAAGTEQVFYEFSGQMDASGRTDAFAAFRQVTGNAPVAYLKGDTGYNNSVSDKAVTNAFKVIAFTFNKGLNGASETSVKVNNAAGNAGGSTFDNTNAFGSYPSYIGARFADLSRFLNGKIFAVMLHPTDLSDADETAVYNAIVAITGAL